MRKKLDLAKLLAMPKLPDYLSTVNKLLRESTETNIGSIDMPITRLIEAGGKRLRPALVVAASQVNGGSVSDNVLKLAAAVELLHMGSLVHDDIIDEANTRWNVATVNKIEGSNQAIVIGDFLLAVACAQAALVNQESAQIIADTIMKLCVGQNLEINDTYNLNRTRSSMLNAIKGKTAALISASCVLGGKMANLDDKRIKSLEKFGQNFGMSFQLIDDLMDLISNEKLYGKPTGNDVDEGVYTLPLLLTLESSYGPELKKFLKTKKYSSRITDLSFISGAIADNIEAIEYYNNVAAGSFVGFKNQMLAKLPSEYFNWTIQNLVAEKYKSKVLSIQKT